MLEILLVLAFAVYVPWMIVVIATGNAAEREIAERKRRDAIREERFGYCRDLM
jgi:hypothetical protein